jgi:hypothetical protein
MRAKVVNEVKNFERNLHPKQAMDIGGGISLGVELWNRKLEYVQSWKDFIEKSFLHKTIYGMFGKYTWDEDKKVPRFEGWANYKVKVEKVVIQGIEKEGLPTEITVVGKDKAWYNIPVDERKIIIE